MKQNFKGWDAVADALRHHAENQQRIADEKDEDAARLNFGQRASLCEIASRIVKNGVLIADEVGMGKTRIAVAVARCVIECGGRVAIVIPPGLGYQWQDELRKGGIADVPPVLRSLYRYLEAWECDEAENQKPWFARPAVLISHQFVNWKLGDRTPSWRWALLPEIYARWREATLGRLPNYYHKNEKLDCAWPSNAAKSIASAVASTRKHPFRHLLEQLLEVQWPRPLVAAEYSRRGALRERFESCIGLGLGIFDLVVIDEAHKSRESDAAHKNGGVQNEKALPRLLNNVILPSVTSRRLALTATPVELDVSQWSETFHRLGLDKTALVPVNGAIDRYAAAVKQLQQTWRSDAEARAEYKEAASHFQASLSPYLLRRDKREDPDVQRFHELSDLPINAYRREREITVDLQSEKLSEAWRIAFCSAESLSFVTRMVDESVAKRLRLTLGNGHGIALLKKDDDREESCDETVNADDKGRTSAAESKRRERVAWWMKTIEQSLPKDDNTLYAHPAILAAVEAIEEETRQDEKVLVFGRFTRPLRALVELLNAREMLRRVESGQPWPQTKVHGAWDGNAEISEWPAVRAANTQRERAISLETLDDTLRHRYQDHRRQREKLRQRGVLIPLIERGWDGNAPDAHVTAIFNAFKRSVEIGEPIDGDKTEQSSLAFVARAILELVGNDVDPSPRQCADAFRELIVAASDRDGADIEDENSNEEEATDRWEEIKARLREEYDDVDEASQFRKRPQGGFARLMFGGTDPHSRRMIQLGFNSRNSFPRVLVAQSLVGREGLNLHKSCRIVVLLHPEWNPGVVEQQIGRVDRVDSLWCKQLNEAIDAGKPTDELPRIEVRPVIFKGTYEEHNWQVLRTRWDELRSQLHGIVIPPNDSIVDPEHKGLIEEISAAAPNFSPTHKTNNLRQAAVRETEPAQTPH